MPRVFTEEVVASIKCPTVELLAAQALAVLVMDLGYTEEPLHGHSPLRHQMMWYYCELTLGDTMQERIDGMIRQKEREDEWSTTQSKTK